MIRCAYLRHAMDGAVLADGVHFPDVDALVQDRPARRVRGDDVAGLEGSLIQVTDPDGGLSRANVEEQDVFGHGAMLVAGVRFYG